MFHSMLRYATSSASPQEAEGRGIHISRLKLLEMLRAGLPLMKAANVEPDADVLHTLSRLCPPLQVGWSYA